MSRVQQRAVFTLGEGKRQRTLFRIARVAGAGPNKDGFIVDVPVLRTRDHDHFTYHDNGRRHRALLDPRKKRVYRAILEGLPLDKIQEPELLVFVRLGLWPYLEDEVSKLAPADPRLQMAEELTKVRWQSSDEVVVVPEPESGALCAAAWLIPSTPEASTPVPPTVALHFAFRLEHVDPRVFVGFFVPRDQDPSIFYASPISPWADETAYRWT